MGNRFRGGVLPGAMPPLHRYLGNPVLSFVGRLFFNVTIGDFHCGIRAFRATSIRSLNLRTTGMEFASEMVVKAALANLRITEVPTTLKPDGRTRKPHLRTWQDGWRHLRFLCLFSPRWLFFYPGITMTAIGLLLSLWLLPGTRQVGGISFDVDSLTYALGLLLIGVNITVFAVSAKLFGTRQALLPPSPRFERLLNGVSLEVGLFGGILLLALGAGLFTYAFFQWHAVGFGELTAQRILRLTLPSATCLMLGVEIIFASFFLGLIKIHSR
jgi:hypothetical protein